MKTMMAAAAAMLLTASPALAQVADTFDGEAGGATVLNYTGFANFDVTGGSVDLLKQPNIYGLGCVGGAGSCVDLDGSTGQAGTLTTKNSFAYGAGSLVTLSFDLSGNMRGAGMDSFFAGFTFSTVTDIADYTLGGAFGGFDIGGFTTDNIQTSSGIADNAPFSTYSISFRTLDAGTLKAYIGAYGNDNMGPILDNVSLSVAAVPEPATWGLMILGFGAIGGTMRVRSRKARVAIA